MGGRGGRVVDDRKSLIHNYGDWKWSLSLQVCDELRGGKMWSEVLKSECFDVELCESLAALGLFHPSVKTGLPSPVLKTDRTDWNILNYCRYSICIVSEIYFHSLPLPRYTTSRYLRAQDPLKVYSNANTWENFIAKVNKTIRDDGADL